MNKYIFLLVAIILIVIGWYFLSPLFIDDKVNENLPIDSNSPEIFEEISSANFQDADSYHKTSGEVKIVQSENKKYLRFENFEATNGPDLKVYLSKDLQASEFISLGDLKGNIGNQNYELPADFNQDDYPYVLIWCEQFSVLFGSAQLS
ncbi:MAG: DM13 domain-containing protein [Nanoarchaeota archaeon]